MLCCQAIKHQATHITYCSGNQLFIGSLCRWLCATAHGDSGRKAIDEWTCRSSFLLRVLVWPPGLSVAAAQGGRALVQPQERPVSLQGCGGRCELQPVYARTLGPGRRGLPALCLPPGLRPQHGPVPRQVEKRLLVLLCSQKSTLLFNKYVLRMKRKKSLCLISQSLYLLMTCHSNTGLTKKHIKNNSWSYVSYIIAATQTIRLSTYPLEEESLSLCSPMKGRQCGPRTWPSPPCAPQVTLMLRGVWYSRYDAAMTHCSNVLIRHRKVYL